MEYQSEIPEKYRMNSQKQKSEGIGDCIELFHFERISYSVNRKSEDVVRLEHLYLHDKWLRENKFLLPDGRLPFRQPPSYSHFCFYLMYLIYEVTVCALPVVSLSDIPSREIRSLIYL